jgi:hypothetical protein
MDKSKQSLPLSAKKSNGKQERSSKPNAPPINSYLYFTSKKKESGDLQGYNAVDYTKALSTEWRASGVKEVAAIIDVIFRNMKKNTT